MDLISPTLARTKFEETKINNINFEEDEKFLKYIHDNPELMSLLSEKINNVQTKRSKIDCRLIALYYSNDPDLEELNFFKNDMRKEVQRLRSLGKVYLTNIYTEYEFQYFGNIDMVDPSEMPKSMVNEIEGLRSRGTTSVIPVNKLFKDNSKDFLFQNKGFIGDLENLKLLYDSKCYNIFQIDY